jgi:hypothetical protein
MASPNNYQGLRVGGLYGWGETLETWDCKMIVSEGQELKQTKVKKEPDASVSRSDASKRLLRFAMAGKWLEGGVE